MPERIGANYYLSINSVDLSAYVIDLQIKRTSALEKWTPSTPGSQLVYENNLNGAITCSVTVTMADDFAAGKVHATLDAGFGSPYSIVAALNGSTPTVTNEVLTDQMVLAELGAGGAAGKVLQKQITLTHATGVPVFATA
jgi:hypothetical protein